MGKERKIKRIFIANRGEIAVRIIHTCKEMNIETAIAYCPADKGSLFTLIADYAYSFKTNELSETYLNSQQLILVAKELDCDAIHPGYGFLSENAQFAQSCREAKINFIGPQAEVIALMGDKISARKKVAELNIPLLPSLKVTEFKNIKKIKEDIGFPILIKASAGGGGRGMRVVHHEKKLEQNLLAAQSEAKSAFGDGTVYIEKYLEFCRHIEVQVLSDSHGNHYHFFERECSIQRRHQKVIEEAPSSILTSDQRNILCETALKITKGINYLNAGTVEFLWEKGNFYFLEMNTRLQVEHAITEMVTGSDLVRAQIEIAQGKSINDFMSPPVLNGHAIEARVYAENPENNFMPTGGKITSVGRCNIPNTRVETSFLDNLEVPLQFDSMLAKICSWSSSRAIAAKKLKLALEAMPFSGIITNNSYLQKILESKAFLEKETFTNFIDNFELSHDDSQQPVELIAAALLKLHSSKDPQKENFYNPWLNHD